MPFALANTAGMTRNGMPMVLTDMARRQSNSPTWEDIAWIRENFDGPVLVKGVLTAEDSYKALDLGCNGVVVSNHGGRQLEGAPATIDVLPEIVAAVGSQMEVLLDGGVRRGGDVVKALALGAKAVLIGRPYVWGLALGGQAGVSHVLEQLHAEVKRSMQLLGCTSIHDLDPGWLTQGKAKPADVNYKPTAELPVADVGRAAGPADSAAQARAVPNAVMSAGNVRRRPNESDSSPAGSNSPPEPSICG
jgi:isopentenyl diphosphate isomerase/L-lactate dehydrogenase-like FMN-dependent dehydrogenase